MRRARGSDRGIALFYVMCLTLVISVFLTAALYRYTTSLRFLQFDAGTVNARMLADSGANLAVVMLRDRSTTWYLDERFGESISSADLGYAEEDLEGTFELEFRRLDELYQGRGSYLTVVSTGRSHGRVARTAATVKITSPLTNFVTVSNGNYDIGAWGNPSITGPLFVNASGDEGRLRIWHDNVYPDPYKEGEFRHSGGNVNLGIEAKAVGDVEISNLDYLNRTGAGLSLEGEYPKGTIEANSDLPLPIKGKVTFVEDSAAQSNVEVNLKIPSTEEALFAFRNRENVATVDVSAYGEGVLAEFVGGELVISEAKRKVVGKVFDKSAMSQHMSSYRRNAADQYEVSEAEAEQMLWNETVLDDPLFPDAEYPDALKTDSNGDGVVEETGDYFEVARMTRGNEIARFSLSDADFTSVRLVTDNTGYPSDFPGGTKGPDLYVRGVVDGKVSLAYDVNDESLDPNFDKLHTFVLGEHEVPGDNLNTIASGPGVPGGITYANPNVAQADDPKSPGDSDDLLYLLARGNFSGTGQPAEGKKQVFLNDGTSIDYEQQMKELDDQYVSHYAGGDSRQAANLRLTRYASPQLPLYGVFVGNFANRTTYRTTSNMGGLGRVDKFRWSTRWNSVPYSPQAPATDQDVVLGMSALRMSYANHTVYPNLVGSLSSLGRRTSFSYGNAAYDYRLQSLDGEALTISVGVPTSIVLCSWQRL